MQSTQPAIDSQPDTEKTLLESKPGDHSPFGNVSLDNNKIFIPGNFTGKKGKRTQEEIELVKKAALELLSTKGKPVEFFMH